MFENDPDPKVSRPRVQSLSSATQWTIRCCSRGRCGVADHQDEIDQALRSGHFGAYPTTIFLGRDGRRAQRPRRFRQPGGRREHVA